MDAFVSDLKQALRSIALRPGFAALVVLPLALGIGMNTAIFSAVHAVLLKSLPYRDPDTLVRVWEARPRMGRDASRMAAFSMDHFRAWRESNDVFEAMAVYGGTSFNLAPHTPGDEPRRIEGQSVSPAFFPILGVEPIHGRVFAAEEEIPGRDRVAVLSHSFWQRAFGGDTLVGRTLQLDGNPYTVVGVMPPDFRFPDSATEIWVPRAMAPAPPSSPGEMRVELSPVLARLSSGVTIEQAEAAGDAFLQNYRERSERTRRTDEGVTIHLTSLREQIVWPVRPALFALLAAVGVVLVIVCANVANLLLVRSQGRDTEIAVRAALGAGRGRLLGKLFTDSLVFGLAGGTLGLVVAHAGVRLIAWLEPPDVPLLDELAIDAPVLAFNLLVALVTVVLVGAAPALRAARVDVVSGLKGSAAAAAGSLLAPRPARLRNVLASAEVALALVLFVTAGLLLRSFLTLARVDPGYEPRDVLTFRVDLPATKYPDGPTRRAFFDRLRETLDGVDGVSAAGITNVLPLDTARYMASVPIEGRPRPADPRDIPHATIRVVSPGYFRAMGIGLRRGRTFAESDRTGSPAVILVNEALVRRYLEDEDPIGRRVAGFGEIVGVVADVRQEGLDAEPEPEFYVDYRQIQGPAVEILSRTSVAIRYDPAAGGILPAVRASVRGLDAELPLADVRRMEDRLVDSVARPRLYAVLLGTFAALALALAVSGVYSVISYSVTQRAREMGLRMALGATESEIVRGVLSDGARILGWGLVLGLGASVLLGRSLSSLLFSVDPFDPWTYGVVTAALVAAVLAACALPARQAARLDPVRALRHE